MASQEDNESRSDIISQSRASYSNPLLLNHVMGFQINWHSRENDFYWPHLPDLILATLTLNRISDYSYRFLINDFIYLVSHYLYFHFYRYNMSSKWIYRTYVFNCSFRNDHIIICLSDYKWNKLNYSKFKIDRKEKPWEIVLNL